MSSRVFEQPRYPPGDSLVRRLLFKRLEFLDGGDRSAKPQRQPSGHKQIVGNVCDIQPSVGPLINERRID